MRRFWFGVGVLVVFLAIGLWVCAATDDMTLPVSDYLQQAAEQALSGDLSGGIASAQRAKSLWQAHWNSTAAVADHAPMDEIDSLFAQLQAYATAGAAEDFAASCARTALLVEAVAEAHRPTWWNFL